MKPIKENIDPIKTTGFVVPKGYFEQFSQNIKNKTIGNNPLSGKYETGFGLPDGYFEKSKSQILSSVQSEKRSRLVYLFNNYARYAAVAAVLVFVFYLIRQPQQQTADDMTALQWTDVQTYLDNTLSTYNTDVNNLFTDEMDLSAFSEVNLSDAVLEDYLTDHLSNSLLTEE